MENNKIIALGQFFNREVEIAAIKTTENNIFEVEGQEFYVLTDAEAQEIFEDIQRDLIDDLGIEGFTEYGANYITQNCIDFTWFDEVMEESFQSYIDDIREEPGAEEGKTRLDEEMEEAGAETEEDFLEYLTEGEDSYKWYVSNFSTDNLKDIIKQYNLLDVNKIIEFIQEEDGRGNTIASYDGEENIEEVDGVEYFIYRIN